MEKKTKKLNMRQRHILEAYMFITPWLVGFAIFFANPIVQSFRLSMSRITKLNGFVMEWSGLVNYERAFLWDVNFIPMFLNTLADTVLNTPITMVFALFIAMLINNKIVFKGFFRAVFFLPVLLGTGFVMKQILGLGVDSGATSVVSNISLPGSLYMYLGGFAQLVYAFLQRITVIFWKSGVQIILFLAGLQGIASSLYEAAVCDGATSWEKFWKITFPMISPVILLNFIYTMIDSFTDSNNPIVEYVLTESFARNQFEYGAAMSWLYFVFIFLMCMAAFVVARRHVFNIGEK
jgi:ABC-type sugar transport system permease subunit